MPARICALLVTYNRKDLLLECLNALQQQTYPLETICLVDNASSDGTPETLQAAGYLSATPPAQIAAPWVCEQKLASGINLRYVRMPDNSGGAGGFHEAMRQVMDEEFDWLWLMDDDAEPRPDSLAQLSKHWNAPDLSGLACVVENYEGVSLVHRGHFDFSFDRVFPLLHQPLDASAYQSPEECVDIDMASFVGLLVKADLLHSIGLPKKEFFIHNDDAEFCIRLRQQGKIRMVKSSVILHKEKYRQGIANQQRFKMESFRPPYDKLWLMYFPRRNLVWLGKQYHQHSLRFYSGVLKSYLRAMAGVLLFDREHKIRRMQFLTAAYLDGLRGVFNNHKPRKILYDETL